jgi:hypothetical protein
MTLGMAIYQHEIESFLGIYRFQPDLEQRLWVGVQARFVVLDHQFLTCGFTYPQEMHPATLPRARHSRHGPSVALIPVIQRSGLSLRGVGYRMHRCPDFAQGTGKGLAAGLRDLVLEVRVLGLLDYR